MNININKVSAGIVFLMLIGYGVLWMQMPKKYSYNHFEDLKENMVKAGVHYDDAQAAKTGIDITCRFHANILEVFEEEDLPYVFGRVQHESLHTQAFTEIILENLEIEAYEAYGQQAGEVEHPKSVMSVWLISSMSKLDMKEICLDSSEGERVHQLIENRAGADLVFQEMYRGEGGSVVNREEYLNYITKPFRSSE